MIKAILKPVKWVFRTLISLVKYIFNIPITIIKSVIKIVKAIVQEVINVVSFIVKKIWQLIKFIWEWLKEAFVETLNQLWTLLGMFAAWLVLEGSAKTIVGYAILVTLGVWLITIRIRGDE